RLEEHEKIEDDVLQQVAAILKVPVEAIRNFNEQTATSYFNTFNDNSVNYGPLGNYQCTFNPIEKLIEVMEENKSLYERLLSAEKEKITLLERLLEQQR